LRLAVNETKGGEMGRKFSVATAAIAALVLCGSGAFAASRYLITSTRQVKPSVLKQFQQRLNFGDFRGGVASMCPSGTDTTGQCEVGVSDARCSGKSPAMGGGFDGGSNPPSSATIGYSEPDSDGLGWHVVMVNQSSLSANFQAVAVCLGAVGNFARDARGGVPGSVRTQIAGEVSKLRAAIR
jgi:hypothetical protein